MINMRWSPGIGCALQQRGHLTRDHAYVAFLSTACSFSDVTGHLLLANLAFLYWLHMTLILAEFRLFLTSLLTVTVNRSLFSRPLQVKSKCCVQGFWICASSVNDVLLFLTQRTFKRNDFVVDDRIWGSSQMFRFFVKVSWNRRITVLISNCVIHFFQFGYMLFGAADALRNPFLINHVHRTEKRRLSSWLA